MFDMGWVRMYKGLLRFYGTLRGVLLCFLFDFMGKKCGKSVRCCLKNSMVLACF